MSSRYPSPLDSLVFETAVENETSIEEMQANLALWTNTQFTFDALAKNDILHMQPSFTYSSPLSSSSSMSSPTSVTYESLANYLDFELPRQHFLPIQPKGVMKSDELTSNLLATTTKDNNKQSNFTKEKTKEKTSIEEEKRKRNTAASARFRIKKKQREQVMEKAVQDMTEKSKKLENYVQELESEIKFLKSLLLEKESCKPLFEETQTEENGAQLE